LLFSRCSFIFSVSSFAFSRSFSHLLQLRFVNPFACRIAFASSFAISSADQLQSDSSRASLKPQAVTQSSTKIVVGHV
jgi:DeoR/GlpR family transcriptional regulator of sugar metabolism